MKRKYLSPELEITKFTLNSAILGDSDVDPDTDQKGEVDLDF